MKQKVQLHLGSLMSRREEKDYSLVHSAWQQRMAVCFYNTHKKNFTKQNLNIAIQS